MLMCYESAKLNAPVPLAKEALIPEELPRG